MEIEVLAIISLIALVEVPDAPGWLILILGGVVILNTMSGLAMMTQFGRRSHGHRRKGHTKTRTRR